MSELDFEAARMEAIAYSAAGYTTEAIAYDTALNAQHRALVDAAVQREREQYAPLVAAVREWRGAHYGFYAPTVSQQDAASRQRATQRLGEAEAALVLVPLPEVKA